MTTTPAKSRQQNVTQFIKTTLLLSTFLLSLSGQSFAAPVSQSQSDLNAVNSYLGKVKAVIQSRFYDSDTYRGRTCELRLELASDGLLESVTSTDNSLNDASLCDAVIRASKLGTMPKPPSLEVYNAFIKSGLTLVFKP